MCIETNTKNGYYGGLIDDPLVPSRYGTHVVVPLQLGWVNLGTWLGEASDLAGCTSLQLGWVDLGLGPSFA